MNGPDGLLVHLNQQVVLLDVSSDRNCEWNAPVCDSNFPQLGRFEQILSHILQFCCERLLVGSNCCDVISSVQFDKSLTDF